MPVYTGDKFGFGKDSSGSVGAGASAGEAFFPEPGQFDWVCPAGVTKVCAVCIGGGGGGTRDEMGGGGGGGLGYKNNISVTPGQSYKIQVGAGGAGDVYMTNYGATGGDSWFINATTVKGGGGGGTGCTGETGDHDVPGYGGRGGIYVGDGGGFGGNGGDGNRSSINGVGSDTGGGGAGGYGGNGGQGGDYNGNWSSGTAGNNGAGGGGCTNPSANEYWGGGGGGVSVYGRGRNGDTGSTHSDHWNSGGVGGSGGAAGWGNGAYQGGTAQVNGGQYGGGGGSTDHRGGIGASGAVRIIWGTGREFPKNGVDDFWSETITRYTAPTAGDITTTSSNWFRGGLGEEDNGSYSSNYNYNGIVPNVSGHDNLDADFTLECWIYCERLTDNTQTFGSGTDGWGSCIMDGRLLQNSGSDQLGSWWISRGNSRRGSTGPYFLNYAVQGGGNFTSDTECIQQCTWHHVALTRQNNTYWLWVDGVKVNSVGEQGPGGTGGTPTTLMAQSDRPVIGGWGYGGRMHYWSYYGNISNFRITKGLALYDGGGTNYTVPTFPLTTTVPAGGSVQCLCCGVDNDYEKDLVNARVWSGPNCMPSALGPGASTEDIVKKGYRIWGRHRGLGGGTQNGQNGSAGDGGLLSTWKKSTGSFQTEQFSTHGGWSTSATTADGISIKVMPGGSYATGDNATAKWNLRSIAYGMPSYRPRKNTLGNGPFIENVHIKVMAGQDSNGTVIYDSGQFTLRIPSYNDYNSNGGTPSKERYTSGAFEIVLPNGGAEDLDMNTWYSVYLKGMEHPNVNDWNSSNGTPGANKSNYWYSESPVSYSANSATYNEMRYAPSSNGDSDAIVIRLEQATFSNTSWASNNHGSFNPLGQSPFFGISMPINFMNDTIPEPDPNTHVSFKTPGSFTWTVPAGVTAFRAVVIGGGGGGGMYGGGGGGGSAMKLFSGVTPGTTYSLTVGSGGGRSQGAMGQDTVFTGPVTLIGGGGTDGPNGNQGSSHRASGGSGTNGTVNGTGGVGYPYVDNPQSTWGYLHHTSQDGTNGAGGGGGAPSDNGDAGHGGVGSYYAGGGGGGGSDNGHGGDGGNGGTLPLAEYVVNNDRAFGGGGGGTDGTHSGSKFGGTGGTSAGGDGYHSPSQNNPGGAGGGVSGGAGGQGNGQNSGGGGGAAFGGGGGGAGHNSNPNGGGAGGGGLVYISYGPSITDSY